MHHADSHAQYGDSAVAVAPRGLAARLTSCGSSLDETGAPLVVDRTQGPPPSNAWQAFKRKVFARSSMLRSPPFRIGMTFWVLFCLTVGFAGYGFYQTLVQQSLDRIDGSLGSIQSLVGNIYENEGIDGVVGHLQKIESRPMRATLGFYLSAPGSGLIASNIDVDPGGPGLQTLDSEALSMEPGTTHYRFLTQALGSGYELSVGRSLAPLDELRGVAMHCLAWALAGSMLLSILAAVWIARQYNCRMYGFRNALAQVAEGNLAARVPVSSSLDDIDDLALHINAAVERLQENMDSIRQVSIDIAHDLKTPLNRLHIHLDEACNHVETLKGERSEKACLALDEAFAEAEHINSTFEALLRVAQIESGARRASFASFNLAEVIGVVYEVYEPVAEDSGHVLINKLDQAADIPMLGERELIMQLIINLVENAVHHSPEGVNITIDGGVSDERVWLSVSDNGPGIPEELHDKVFQRLYRLERSRTTRGTGLGLSMVKAIATLHGGYISLADNKPGLSVIVGFCPSVSDHADV